MLIVLIGPKGSGKSHIGRLLETRLGVHFFHVEPHWMDYFDDCDRRGVERSIGGGIEHVHPVLEEGLGRHDRICIETTGASREILDDLLSFEAVGPLRLIRIEAPLEVCLERIRRRDPTHQIPMDEAGIRRVYALGRELDLDFDLVVENVSLSEEEIIRRLRPVLDPPIFEES